MEIDLEKFKKHKDLEVVFMAETLQAYIDSPLVDAYISIKKQLDTWAKELDKNPSTLAYNSLSGDDDQKYFDKVHKYISTVDAMYEKLSTLRAKMSNQQEKVLDKKLEKSTTVAI
jgi:GTPase involved in cell partitioning and DNA repair